MSHGAGPSAVMGVVSGAAGVIILHMGIAMATGESSQMLHIGQTMTESTYPLSMSLIGLGCGVMGISGKMFALSIGALLFPERATPSELWDEMSASLKYRLYYTVSKGFSRVVLRDDDLHEMMRLEKQRHVRLIGKVGGVVEISKQMTKHIASTPMPTKPVVSSVVTSHSNQPDSFWTPQPNIPVPQNS